MFDVPGPRRRLVGQDSQLLLRNYWKLARQTSGPSPHQQIRPINQQVKCLGSDVELGFPCGGVFVAEMLKALPEVAGHAMNLIIPGIIQARNFYGVLVAVG